MTVSFNELSFPVGKDLVDLPSGGLFYKKDHPLCGQSCVEILHMRGVEEDILTNRDLIKRDLVVDKLLHSIIVDSRLKENKAFNQILTVDQSKMILQARITAYTWEYPVTLFCPRCKESVKYCFDLRKSKHILPDVENDPYIKFLEDENLWEITIPETTIVVKVQPFTIGVQSKLRSKILSKKKKESILSYKEKYEDVIISINDNTDNKLLDSFFKLIPSFYLKWFESVLVDINPKLSLEQTFQCENCDHTEEIEPPFTTDFLFTPKVKREIKKASESQTQSGSE